MVEMGLKACQETEFEQPHLSGLGHQNVRGLDVSVDDALLVRILHRPEYLQD